MAVKVTMRTSRAAEPARPAEPRPAGDTEPQNELAKFIASIPNFAVKELGTVKLQGVDVQQLAVSYGEPVQTVTIRVLDAADEWDLAEMAGDAGKSEQWMMMSRAAASVIMIGATSYSTRSLTRDHLRNVMRQLGVPGVNAVSAAQAGMRPSAGNLPDPKAAAKNS